MNTRILRVSIAVILGLALAAAVALYQAPAPAPETTGVAGAPIGGSFAGLTDHNGRVLTEGDLSGKAQLVFFGFTHCPSICPTELQKMTLLLQGLTEAERARLDVIFVTVDPERDTPEAMREYLGMFHPAIIGLRGTPEQTEAVKKDWKVYAARVQTPEMTEYTVDHSAFTYFRDENGGLLALFSMTDSSDKMGAAVRGYLAQ